MKWRSAVMEKTSQTTEAFSLVLISSSPNACAKLLQVMRKGKTVDSVTGAAEDKLRKMVAEHCKKTK